MQWIKVAEFSDEVDLSQIDHQLHTEHIPHRFTLEAERQCLWLHDGPEVGVIVARVDQLLRDPSQMNCIEPTRSGSNRVSEKPDQKGASLSIYPAWTTLSLVALCFVGAALYSFDSRWIGSFTFWNLDERIFRDSGIFRDILAGDIWRVLTPVFLHFGFVHVVFNALWLWFLGTQIEREAGVAKFLFLVVLIGISSNVGQVLVSAQDMTDSRVTLIGGMSGVVHGLLSYVWLAKKINPRLPYQITDALFAVMTGLMLISALGVFSWFLGEGVDIADTAHFVGYATGLLAAVVNNFSNLQTEKNNGI